MNNQSKSKGLRKSNGCFIKFRPCRLCGHVERCCCKLKIANGRQKSEQWHEPFMQRISMELELKTKKEINMIDSLSTTYRCYIDHNLLKDSLEDVRVAVACWNLAEDGGKVFWLERRENFLNYVPELPKFWRENLTNASLNFEFWPLDQCRGLECLLLD